MEGEWITGPLGWLHVCLVWLVLCGSVCQLVRMDEPGGDLPSYHAHTPCFTKNFFIVYLASSAFREILQFKVYIYKEKFYCHHISMFETLFFGLNVLSMCFRLLSKIFKQTGGFIQLNSTIDPSSVNIMQTFHLNQLLETHHHIKVSVTLTAGDMMFTVMVNLVSASLTVSQ